MSASIPTLLHPLADILVPIMTMEAIYARPLRLIEAVQVFIEKAGCRLVVSVYGTTGGLSARVNKTVR